MILFETGTGMGRRWWSRGVQHWAAIFSFVHWDRSFHAWYVWCFTMRIFLYRAWGQLYSQMDSAKLEITVIIAQWCCNFRHFDVCVSRSKNREKFKPQKQRFCGLNFSNPQNSQAATSKKSSSRPSPSKNPLTPSFRTVSYGDHHKK